MMNFISDVFELVFWVLFLVAIWKYNVLSKLPGWLSIAIVSAMGASGIAGLLSHHL